MRFLSLLLIGAAVPSVALAAVAKPAASVASERPLIGAPAPWVLPATIPPAPPAAEGASTIDLLSDLQTRFSADGDTTYNAVAYKIATPQGLDSGALDLSWDPALETLTIHRYGIIRDGKTIDLLGDGSKLSVMRREKNLEQQALDGQLTATLQPEDLRVGDVIDLAYSRTRRDPAMGGNSELLVGPHDGVPYGRNRIRMLWPAAKQMHWHVLPGVIQPQLRHAGDENELVSDLTNVTTPRPPQGAPSRFRVVNAIEITQFADWPSVSRLLAPLYAKATTLAPDSPLKSEARRIAAATPDPKKRASLALRLVQEQVRYLFLGMNDGGYVPAAADATWARRFGDCKAKTALLVALLRELGIDARPVLVNTQEGDFVATRLPMVGAFDHAIVEARIGGRSYWLDGTRLGDRDLDQLKTPNYHAALPILAGGAPLEPLVPEPLTEPSETISLDLDASAGIEAPAPAKGEMRFRGEAAANKRLDYADMSAADRDTELRKLWRKTYDFVTPTAVSTRDDPATGDFILSMTGTAKMEWIEDAGTRWYELDRARLGWKFDIVRDDQLSQDAPFAFDYPDWWQSRETIKLPYNGAGFRLQGGAVDRSIGGLYAFHREVKLDHGVLAMEADTRALQAELPAAKAAQAREQMGELSQTGVYVRLPNDYEPTVADFAALKANPTAAAKAYMQRGIVRFDRGDISGSLADETAAIALDGDLPLAHSIRALALSRRADPETDAEADRAIKLDAGQGIAWRAKGLAAMKTDRYLDADKYFTKAIEIDDQDEHSYAGRAGVREELGRHAEALADVDKALEIDPKMHLSVIRALALAGVGRREDAMAEADRGVASQPDDADARLTRAQILIAFGRRDQARADMDVLITRNPRIEYYLMRVTLWNSEDKAKRKADIDAALRLDPRSIEALRYAAADAIESGAFDQAQTYIAAAEKVRPDAAFLYSLRVALFSKRHQPREALQAADVMIAKFPGDASAYNERCWLKATLNISADTAVADCETALKLQPGTPAFLDSRAFAKLRTGAIDGAIADYDAALKAAPNLPASLYGRGLAKARRGDRAGALEDIMAARKLVPGIDAEFAGFGMTAPDGSSASNSSASK
jgi:tetratricopeptide (TPR) repeat protein